MAFAGHQHNHAPGVGEKDYYDDSRIEDASLAQTRTFQPPELVRNMSPEKRAAAEARLKRKIDLRLLPMIILMYILNYLDRNNIASARLAGLQDNLNLTNVQYSVSMAEYDSPRSRKGLELMSHISDLRQYSVRRISLDASPKQSVLEQDWQAGDISTYLHGNMGSHIWCHSCLSDIWRAGGLSIHARLHRGSIFRKPCRIL